MEYISNHFLFHILIITIVINYFLYSNIIKKRNKALEALSSIDVQLTKRHDLLPNILKIAQSFMKYEKDLITEITILRTQVSRPYDYNNPDEIKKQLDLTSLLH